MMSYGVARDRERIAAGPSGEYPVEPGFPGKRSANTVARYAHGGTPIELRSPKG